MNNLIIITAFLTFTFSASFATTTPETLISTEDVEVVTIGNLEIFTSADYDEDSENLSFTTNEDISVIQIFDADGIMEFQLPVMSNVVEINKNVFGEGVFKLGFMLKGQSHLHFTSVTIK